MMCCVHVMYLMCKESILVLVLVQVNTCTNYYFCIIYFQKDRLAYTFFLLYEANMITTFQFLKYFFQNILLSKEIKGKIRDR